MIYKGTDMDAFEKASKGLTKNSRSKKYKKYKAQNEKRREKEAASSIFGPTLVPKISIKEKRIRRIVKPTQNKQVKRYIEKKNILDDIRDYRSSKIVSNLSNNLATFIVKHGGRRWDNETKNIVRSSIALAISEVTNKVLEKPQKIIDNIKLFIKVGMSIYKIIVWIDEVTNLWATNEKSISIANDDDIEYVEYIRKYPSLAKSIQIANKMKYKIGDVVLLNNEQIVRIVSINIYDNTYKAISVDKNQKEYIITDKDIRDYVKI